MQALGLVRIFKKNIQLKFCLKKSECKKMGLGRNYDMTFMKTIVFGSQRGRGSADVRALRDGREGWVRGRDAEHG